MAIVNSSEKSSSTIIATSSNRAFTYRGCALAGLFAPRGHSSLSFGMDTVIAVSQIKDCVQAKLIKQRCGKIGETIKYKLTGKAT